MKGFLVVVLYLRCFLLFFQKRAWKGWDIGVSVTRRTSGNETGGPEPCFRPPSLPPSPFSHTFTSTRSTLLSSMLSILALLATLALFLPLASAQAAALFGFIDAVANASLLQDLAPSYTYIIVGGGNGNSAFLQQQIVQAAAYYTRTPIIEVLPINA